jgi:hypothetical protein
MPRFLSNRQKNLRLGIKDYTENDRVLEILGQVGIGTTFASDYTVGIGGSVRIDGNVTIGGTLISDYTGIGTITALRINLGSIGVGDTEGDDGQYLRSTGAGVTWASFPQIRTGFSTIGVSSQTSFTTVYNPDFIDIFINGVLLNSSEYQASDGISILLDEPLNGGEVIDIFSWNTTSNYTGGSGGGGGTIVLGGGGYWAQSVVGVWTNTNVGIFTDYPESALVVDGDANISGVVTAASFVGDGSGLVNVIGTGSGVEIKDSGSIVGTAATIDFGENITVSPISAGIVTVSSQKGLEINNNDSLVGVATILNFSTNLDVSFNSGIATISASVSAGGASTTYAEISGISTYTSEWILGANGTSDYTFTGPGLTGAENDPTLFLIRGQQYKFSNTMGAHPFRIQSTPNGSVGTQYNDGITNNDVSTGTLIWNVQFDTPDTLYYQCTSHPDMGGVINILNVSAGGGGGESYWSQNSTGISTISNVGIGTTTATSRLTVDGDGYFTGIITANQFTTQTGGTPTIDSPNNLNINANTVAISTNLTVGSDSSISNNLSVSGIATIGLLDVGVGGTILSSTSDGKVGIGTTNATHILTVGSVGASGTSLFVHGDARIVGILSVGQGTITIDGNTNTISATNIIVSNSLTAEGGVGYATEGYVDNLVAISTFSGDYNDLNNQPNYIDFSGVSTSVSGGIASVTQLNVTGVSTFGGNVFLGDNDSLYFGDGNDLRIYHNGTNNTIYSDSPANLRIQSDVGIQITKLNYTENIAKFIPDGAVELYYDNSKKFETVGTGVSVFGNLYFNDTNYLSEVSSPGEFGSVQINGSGSNNWEGYSIDGRAAFIHDGSSATGLYNDVNNEWFLRAQHNAEVALYHDGSKKLETTGAGATVLGTLETQQLNVSGVSTFHGNIGIGTDNPVKTLDVRGEATFGSGITISDLDWGKDTNQLVYTFSGSASGVNPADGVIALVNPNENPSGSRIGSIVFGNKVSGTTGTNNPGIKAIIEAYTNTNVANAADTGAYMNFYTKPNNANNRIQMTLNSNGVLTKPYQPAFLAYRNTTLSITNTWQLISNGILTEAYDVGSIYSTSTNGRFVAPVAGKYMFYAGGYSAGSSDGERYAFGVKVNGVGGPDFITGGNYCIGDTPLSSYQVVLNLAANDYVELFFYSAISTTLGGSTHVLYWGGYLLG